MQGKYSRHTYKLPSRFRAWPSLLIAIESHLARGLITKTLLTPPTVKRGCRNFGMLVRTLRHFRQLRRHLARGLIETRAGGGPSFWRVPPRARTHHQNITDAADSKARMPKFRYAGSHPSAFSPASPPPRARTHRN